MIVGVSSFRRKSSGTRWPSSRARDPVWPAIKSRVARSSPDVPNDSGAVRVIVIRRDSCSGVRTPRSFVLTTRGGWKQNISAGRGGQDDMLPHGRYRTRHGQSSHGTTLGNADKSMIGDMSSMASRSPCDGSVGGKFVRGGDADFPQVPTVLIKHLTAVPRLIHADLALPKGKGSLPCGDGANPVYSNPNSTTRRRDEAVSPSSHGTIFPAGHVKA